MTLQHLGNRGRLSTIVQRSAIVSALVLVAVCSAYSEDGGDNHQGFRPGNLVVSRSVYDNNSKNIQVGTFLPPHCATGCVAANNDGAYPLVWNNSAVDGSFGITSKILLDQITPSGAFINTIEVPNSLQKGITSTKDQLVTSFPSKSELGLQLSTDRRFLTFMGYVAPVDAIDVSNSNTPGIVDPSNPVVDKYYRATAQFDEEGKFRFTLTNAYSGNNGRGAILNNMKGANLIYTSGNAGNGGDPQPNGIIIGAGAQIMHPESKSESAQAPVDPTPVGAFNITQLGLAHDKIGKDTNFRGISIFNNVLYYTKGSGGNGVNTVYFVDPTGLSCPSTSTTPGVGLPQSSPSLPSSGLAYNPAVLQTKGLDPNNMCILKGFPTSLKSTTSFPFGIWFANDHTLYVADEGNGTFKAADVDTVNNVYKTAAAQTTAGLQKWIFDSTSNTWKLAYTLQAGLALGKPYTIVSYPTGNNPKTKLPWAPATDGLRNITGRVNKDGTATIWAITSTVSGNGDQGADPNKLFAITDNIAATALPATEIFTTVRTAGYGEVLRGVSFTPGTRSNDGSEEADNRGHLED